MGWDLADLMNMQTMNDLASIPDEVATDQAFEKQNEAIRSQNATILKLREQNRQLREKFYQLMDDRDGWQAKTESLLETFREYVDEGEIDRNEVNDRYHKRLETKREEVRQRNGSPV